MFREKKGKKKEAVPAERKSLSPKAAESADLISRTLGNPPDLTNHPLFLGKAHHPARLMGIQNMIDERLFLQEILTPLQELKDEMISLEALAGRHLHAAQFEYVETVEDACRKLLGGSSLLLIEGDPRALTIAIPALEWRPIEEPKAEAVVRGSHEGFVESIDTNVTLLRRKLPDPALRFEITTVGQKTRTRIGLFYIEGLTDPDIVEQVRKRLKEIETEMILESGFIEEFIETEPQSFFPTVGNTEKPDKAVAKLMEGRVVILTDGTPMALTVPYLFMEGFQSPEDYYSRPYYVSMVRLIRHLSFYIATFFPALYIATQNFHKEMLPELLLASIAAARQGVPFPLVMETIFMLLTFEILREGGIRMPRPLGQAISIVGALILGEAAVNAGIVGTPTIIVVAVSGITTFVITPFSDTATLLRFILLIPASIVGLYGLLIAALALFVHLTSLRSFGVPYFAPLAPVLFGDWKDLFIRTRLSKMRIAPKSIPQQRAIRHESPRKR